MPVLHDYYCDIHGIFESFEAKCPMKNCKGELSKVFLKPVGTRSDKTKKTDKTLDNLALDFGMTDIKSTREGEHQSGYFTRNNGTPAAEQPPQPRPGDAAIWGGDKRFSMNSLLAGNAVRPIKDEAVSFNPKAAGNLTGPKAGVIINDHENLQVKQS
jgi:hypothetical protein